MPHEVSPLSMESHRFHAFQCEASESDNAEGALALYTEQKIANDANDPLRWHVDLTVEFKPEDSDEPSTYSGKVRASGEFRIHKSFTEKNREALIRVTATSILYGACREMIANFTARSTRGILSLPSISFRKEKKNEAAENET